MTPQQAQLAQALGAILRSRRAWYLLTQADLAAATGIPRTRVGRFERGTTVPDVWEATQLARALQMPLVELLQPCLALGHPSPEASRDGTADRAASDFPRRDPLDVPVHAACTTATAEGMPGSALTNRPD